MVATKTTKKVVIKVKLKIILKYDLQVIPCEITHSKNGSPSIVFILSTQSIHPMRVHNPEYHPPVTGCTNLVH